MRIVKYTLSLALVLAMMSEVAGHRPPDRARKSTPGKTGATQIQFRGGACNTSESEAELNINNVRARLLGGGDMWWDLDDGRYEIPKVDPASGLESVSSIFAGSVWIGGFDPSGSLKIAAIDYRNAQTNEWWPGPIDEASGATCEEDCDNWDRHFEVTGDDIRSHIANYQRSLTDPSFSYSIDDVPSDIRFWPANGNRFFVERYGFELPNTRQGLGNFFETAGNENNIYEPELGEYPMIDVRGCPPGIFADQMYFWVYNDVGGIHTNTDGDPIQMEVQVQGFGYQTTDAINDMTFYRYKLINRAEQPIDSCFFAMWVDPDLGCYTDDYIGCDSTRSLMYIYNVDELDGTSGCDCNGGVPTYCDEVPVLGVDYFRGPLAPKVRDTITGELRNPKIGEPFDEIVEVGMSSFTYYNNAAIPGTPPAQADPSVGPEFYRYLSGSWRDGTRFTRGGTGYNIGSVDFTNYAVHDEPNVPGGWSMCEEQLPQGDRRTIQASGPLRLDPGAINELIIGVVWVPDQQYPCPDLSELYGADDKAQDLFDNCFELPRGPDAPNVDIIELDQELILVFTNEPEPLSNNENEGYAERGLGIPQGANDTLYRFEGYRVYQVAGPDVTRQELSDDTKAREIATFDVKNGVGTVYNWESVIDPGPSGEQIYFPVEIVAGSDEGIRHTLRITEDRFSRTADSRLANHKDYYFYVVAYGYNNFEQFDTDNPLGTQDEPYLEGRLNVGDRNNGGAPYIGTPRPLVYQKLNASYGDGAVITRLDGVGVGGNFLDISEESEEAILNGTFDGQITYQPGRGPIDVSVFNPLEVRSGTYELKFFDEDMSDDDLEDPVRWILSNDQGDTVVSDKELGAFNEQVIREFGFSVNIGQTDDAGDNADDSNGFIGLELEYEDENLPFWFRAIADGQQVPVQVQGQTFPFLVDFIRNELGQPTYDLDPNSAFTSNVLFPYILAEYTIPLETVSPAWDNNSNGIVVSLSDMQDLNNVDVVFTPDRDKWSRCIVVEAANAAMAQAAYAAIGNAEDFELRQSPSIGKDFDTEGRPIPDGDGVGMSWFPGYAIDVETGERLNIFFAENSAYNQAMRDRVNATFDGDTLIGTDMVWNPSSQILVQELLLPGGGGSNIQAAFTGGQHFVYVTRQPYDSCATIRDALEGGRSINIARQLANITWAMMPIMPSDISLLPFSEGLIPNECRLKMRVDNPYQYAEGTLDHGGYNFYRFEYDGVEPEDVVGKDAVEDALDEVRVVPNPYYGFSEYEVTQFDNFVKITNLPFRSTITIYSIDGRFIRQYKRDEVGASTLGRENAGITRALPNPDLIWDLKNSRNIPVSSGTYLIHIRDEDTGAETTIKWFGVARKFDPSGL